MLVFTILLLPSCILSAPIPPTSLDASQPAPSPSPLLALQSLDVWGEDDGFEMIVRDLEDMESGSDGNLPILADARDRDSSDCRDYSKASDL